MREAEMLAALNQIGIALTAEDDHLGFHLS